MAITVNRYSQTPQFARYTPRTLQELIIAPAYMRQQHDALDAGRMELDSKLAQVSGLDVHNERLKEQQNLLNQQSQQIAENLQKEGFNNSNKSAFMRFNKDYQNAVGPNGEIGKIIAAKEAYANSYKQFIESAPKDWSKETLLRNWNKFQSKYTGFDEANNIINIGQLGAPEKIDLMTKLKDVKSILGEQVVNEISAGNYSVQPQADGSLAIVNRSGRRIETSNSPNIQQALGMIENELSDPNSAWVKSIQFEGLDPTNYQNQVISGLNAMLTNKVTDNRSQSYSRSGYKNANEVAASGVGLTMASEQYAPVKYAGMKYSEVNDRLAELKNKSNLLDSEKTELNELQNFQRATEKELIKNPKYITKQAELNQLENTINDITNGTHNLKNNVTIGGKTYDNPGNNIYQGLSYENKATYLAGLQKSLMKQAGNVREELDSMTKGVIENNQLKMTTYALTPMTPKQSSIIQTANDNISKLLKDNPFALSNIGDIREVIVDGKPVSVSSNDKEGISKLFYEAGKDQVELVSVTPEGLSGNPEYILRLTPKTGDNSYNLDGVDFGSDDVGGTKPVQVRVSFNKTNNGAANNMNGLIQQYLVESGPQGAKLVESMEISRAFNAYQDYTWGELESNNVINNNPILTTIKAQKLIEMGATSKSTPQEIQALELQLNNKKVQKYE